MTMLTSPQRMDVHYDKDTNNVNVNFKLPGLQKDDASIDVHNNVITVSGENKTFSIRLAVNRFRIRFTERAFQYELRAE